MDMFRIPHGNNYLLMLLPFHYRSLVRRADAPEIIYPERASTHAAVFFSFINQRIFRVIIEARSGERCALNAHGADLPNN